MEDFQFLSFVRGRRRIRQQTITRRTSLESAKTFLIRYKDRCNSIIALASCYLHLGPLHAEYNSKITQSACLGLRCGQRNPIWGCAIESFQHYATPSSVKSSQLTIDPLRKKNQTKCVAKLDNFRIFFLIDLLRTADRQRSRWRAELSGAASLATNLTRVPTTTTNPGGGLLAPDEGYRFLPAQHYV